MKHRRDLHAVRRHGPGLDLLPGIAVHVLQLDRVRNLLAVLIERPSKRIFKDEIPVSIMIGFYCFGVKLL